METVLLAASHSPAALPSVRRPRPLRVLTVSDVFHPRVNGVSTSIDTFRTALSAFDVEVRLVVPRYGDEPDTPGVTRIPGRKVIGDPEDRFVRWHDMHAATKREAADCDVIHIQTPFVAHYAGIAAARAHGLPALLTYHTFFEEYLHHYAPLLPGRLLKALARRFSRGQCNAVGAIVVPSSAMRERLSAYGVTPPMHVIPTGIPTATFAGGDRAQFRRDWGIDIDAPLALYVGRVAHEKNIGFLLEVAAAIVPRLPRFTLLIAGEGSARASLEAEVKRRGIEENIKFVGYLQRGTALQDCYAAADAFVFASRTETQGLVLLEAMAAGLPVVALAEMGTRDTLAPERGSRIAPVQPGSFADILLRVLCDQTLRGTLSSEARSYCAQWQDSVMAGRLAELYRDFGA